MIEYSKIQGGNKEYLKELFLEWFSFTFKAVKRYYGKKADNSTEKSCEIIEKAIHKTFEEFRNNSSIPKEDFKRMILSIIVEDVKNRKSEYYISSTVYPNRKTTESHTLFENYEIPDYSSISPEQIIDALSELTPSKRLTFNLHEIDGYSIQEISALLEVGESTVKMNLEKGRYEFQKNLEQSIKNFKNGQNIQV
jgi:RNA polymerase sigma-70 factor (ECF subfamily)